MSASEQASACRGHMLAGHQDVVVDRIAAVITRSSSAARKQGNVQGELHAAIAHLRGRVVLD